MGRNKRQKVLCIFLLIVAIAVAAGITYYYVCLTESPKELRGGVLVHERYVVYTDRQKS